MTNDDAASDEMLRLIKSGFEITGDPSQGDTIKEFGAGELPGIAGKMRTNCLTVLEHHQIRFCSHLIANQDQPVFLRSWHFERALCRICIPVLVNAPIEYPCDNCGGWNYYPGQAKRKLNMQTYNVGKLAWIFGLCNTCTDIMIAQIGAADD